MNSQETLKFAERLMREVGCRSTLKPFHASTNATWSATTASSG